MARLRRQQKSISSSAYNQSTAHILARSPVWLAPALASRKVNEDEYFRTRGELSPRKERMRLPAVHATRKIAKHADVPKVAGAAMCSVLDPSSPPLLSTSSTTLVPHRLPLVVVALDSSPSP